MTGITTRSLQSGTLLSPNELQAMLTREENSSPTPYYDSASPANPTIGIGVNLNSAANLALVLQDLNVPASALSAFQSSMAASFAAYGASPSALNNALNATLANYPGAATSFALTADQVQSLFATVAQTAITGLTQILANNGTNLPQNSPEFMALLSLYYNQSTRNPLIGPTLRKALQQGNRAQVWYQIRYQSDANDPNGGIQRRRYYESQVFGLSTGTDTFAQAEQDFEMLTAKRASILSKEDTVVHQKIGNVNLGIDPDGNSPETITPSSVIGQANVAYGLQSIGGTIPVNQSVQTVSQSFDADADILIAQVNAVLAGVVAIRRDTSNGLDSDTSLAPFEVRSTDIFVAPSLADTAAGFASAAQLDVKPGVNEGNTQANATEGARNHILIGSDGPCTLEGGTGNDILIAGAGQEQLVAGSGSDTLIGGQGLGTLSGAAGNDTLRAAEVTIPSISL